MWRIVLNIGIAFPFLHMALYVVNPSPARSPSIISAILVAYDLLETELNPARA